SRPFVPLASAMAASGDGDTVYVFRGDGSATGLSVHYLANPDERILGQAVDLKVGADTLFVGDPALGPNVQASAGEEAFVLSYGNPVAGLSIDPNGVSAIASYLGPGGDVIRNVHIHDTGAHGSGAMILFNNTDGMNRVDDVTIDHDPGVLDPDNTFGILA